MKKARLFFTVVAFMLATVLGFAQTQVKGTVTAADDGLPVTGASVFVKGTKTGTITDLDGKFTLSVPSSAKTLVVSFMGMKEQEVPVKPVVNVVLESDYEMLGEVVWDTKTNVEKRMLAEEGACTGKMEIAKVAKKLNLDAIHDSVHEMAKDEARHGAGFQGLFNRFFKK